MTTDEIKTMSAAKVAKHLSKYQKWRRGDPPYAYGSDNHPFTPRELGDIINRAIELLNGQKPMLEQIKIDILNLIDSEYDLAHGSEIREVLRRVK